MTNERRGELYMLTLTLFESWFPIVALFSIGLIGSLFTFAFTVLLATLVFLALVFYKKSFGEFLRFDAYKNLMLTSLYITLLFGLIFTGLQYTTAGNMAVIIFLQLVFSYIYFNLFGKEKLSAPHTAGALMMGAGALVILFPADFTLNKGDLLILLAAAIAPVANLYQKRARAQVGSETILAFRSLVSLPFLFGVAYATEALPTAENLRAALIYLLINGVVIMGVSKMLWIEALHRISITKMSAMLALMPLFTLFFAYIALDEVPSLQQIAGIMPILIGGYLITKPSAQG